MKDLEINEDKKNILRILKEKWSNSSSHGIPNIARTDSYLIKFFWIITFLGCTSFFTYLTVQSIFEYFQHDVTSKIRLIKEFPIKFPGIRVCNKDPFITYESIEILADMVQNNSDRFDLSNFAGDSKDKFEVLNYLILNDNDNDKIQKFALNNLILNYDSYKDKLDDGLNERIYSCQFNRFNCSHLITYDFDLTSGLCFIFNTENPYLDIRNIGEFFGLELILVVGKQKKYNYLASSYGSVIYIYNQSYPLSKLNAIEVSEGTETKIAYSRSFNEQEKFPYSDCVISSTDNPDTIKSDYAKDIIKKNDTYTQFNCLIDCLQDSYFNACGCFNNEFDCATCDNKTMCDSNDELFCLKAMNISMEIEETCQKKCPLEYETQSLSFQVSSSVYPTETEKYRLLKRSKILRNFMRDNETIEDKIIKIKIFTESFFYQYVSETPSVTIPNLLASFGGNLGLCLGISLLTLFEIVEIFMEIAFYFDGKKNSKSSDISIKKWQIEV